ncbi:hypothetical protein EUTSA_v10010336mg [Eutrema salsugineum]|uniref:F-box domain-containing protein n=1 Tax=Eutrema salsugineum TaxID=72664 RepID=V4LT26_EUTSA|nr:hypothetical protein EUTSA_v10010336mg [Eutrema salsugineum]
MEHKRKIGGERLRNRDDVLNEDRISELPDDLLLRILSSLPTETVIATSVLSKRWRSLWKMVPKLKFNSEDHKSDHQRFSEIVYRSSLSHKAPVLESLHLVVRDKTEALDVGIWIGIAFAHHLRELVVDLHNQEEAYAIFPSVLFSCDDNTLDSLELKTSILLEFPSRVCLKSLRKLHLDYVVFNDQESVCNLFSACPSLEDLFVERKSNIDVEIFTIAVPSVQRLTIVDEFPGNGDEGYVINAPSLKYLNIKGLEWVESCLIENAPELVEAKIIDVTYVNNENILVSLAGVKRLSLHSLPFEVKYPTGIVFYQLVFLELLTPKERNILSLMLDSCPKLQILKLINPTDCFATRRACPVGWEWSQPKCVPECLLYHLETFVWTKYAWQRDDEKEVAAYILKNARRLKKGTISTLAIESNKLERLEKRYEMLNVLANEVRGSVSCHVLFEADSYSYKSGYYVPHKFSFTLGTTEKE